jgi:hypothetical protein
MTVAVLTSSVPAAREDREDVEQVLGKLVLGASHSLVENHDFSTGLADNELNEFPSKSCKAVSMGNHQSLPGRVANRLDPSLVRVFFGRSVPADNPKASFAFRKGSSFM